MKQNIFPLQCRVSRLLSHLSVIITLSSFHAIYELATSATTHEKKLIKAQRLAFHPATMSLPPGSCLMRLQDLEKMSSDEKKELLSSIAEDIQITLLYVGRHLEAETISHAHAEPIEDMIKKICETEIAKRRRLKRKMRQRESQSARMQREQQKLLEGMKEVVQMYEKKTRELRQRVRSLQAQAQTLKPNPTLPVREETLLVDGKRKRADTESLASQSGEEEVEEAEDEEEEEQIENGSCCNEVESEMDAETQQGEDIREEDIPDQQ